MNTLAIIIVSWNTQAILLECLRSVYTHTPTCTYEVWVVDNASTDVSSAAVRSNFPQVHLIENPQNIGFAQANNQALQASDSTYALLLNSDTLVQAGAFDALVDFLERHPRSGACGPYLLNPDFTLQVSCYPYPTLTREFWRLFHLDRFYPYGIYDMAAWKMDEPRHVKAIKGACLMLRRNALDQTGLLDPGYFMYTEEIDLCYRIQKAGWQLDWVPQAKVVHLGGQSTRLMATEMFLTLYQTKIRFFRKHYGWFSALVYKWILLMASLFRIGLSPWQTRKSAAGANSEPSIARRYFRLITTLPKM